MKTKYSYESFYRLVQQIPEGSVATYGQLARLSGIKNPRFVGSLLHKNPDPDKTPCHRVVNSKGQLALTYAFGGAQAQQKRLEREGLVIANGKLDVKRYLWAPQ